MKNTPNMQSTSRQTGVIQSKRSRVVSLKRLLRSKVRDFTKKGDPPLNTRRPRWQRRNAGREVNDRVGAVALNSPGALLASRAPLPGPSRRTTGKEPPIFANKR